MSVFKKYILWNSSDEKNIRKYKIFLEIILSYFPNYYVRLATVFVALHTDGN